jgi:O-antigen/teichoic acid export membrane protein
MIIALHTFVWLYFVNLLPSLSRLATSEGRAEFDRVTSTSMRLVGWVVVSGSIVGGALAPIIFRFYSPKYPDAAGLFAIMLWMIAAAFVSGQCRYALIALRHQQDELKANLAGCLVSIGGCLLAGRALTPLVAASIFVAAEVTTLAAAWLLCRRCGRPIAVLRPLAGPLLSGAISVGVVFSWAGQYPLLAGVAVVLIQGAGLALFDRRLPRDAVELLRPNSNRSL